eukprot:TRINITY_DN668_c0_g1_i1.p1 TRINITY_DN668_c0_g1~~TRINITY_DN668_c0_g1_i1.p1  ORF type:complete len:132 (+),score=28.85 TRINITY_DN668_c0_g1_i1:285-680(+)
MTPIYYKNAAGAIIVFDLSDPSTFKAVDKWKNDLIEKLHTYTDEKIPILLVGNKNDMITDGYPGVTDDEVEEYLAAQDEANFIDWFRVSAKTKENVIPAVETLVTQVVERASPVVPTTFPEQENEDKCCMD